MESPSNGDLPADVILEILLSLPVKALLRFKCVCKCWHTLIGSRSFVDWHLGHESNQECLLVRNYKPNRDLYSFALFVDEICSGYEEPDHLQMPDTVDDLIEPMNGVFCVFGQSRRKMALVNPAMKQFKPLPETHPDTQAYKISINDAHGFGLDPLSRDYKLVSIQYLWNEEMDHGHYHYLVSVYNSGSDSWRHFKMWFWIIRVIVHVGSYQREKVIAHVGLSVTHTWTEFIIGSWSLITIILLLSLHLT